MGAERSRIVSRFELDRLTAEGPATPCLLIGSDHAVRRVRAALRAKPERGAPLDRNAEGVPLHAGRSPSVAHLSVATLGGGYIAIPPSTRNVSPVM